MSSTCVEPEGSSSGRRLYMQLWYIAIYMHQYKQLSRYRNVLDTEYEIWQKSDSQKKKWSLKSCLPKQNWKTTSNVFHNLVPETENAIKLLAAQLHDTYSILVTKQVKQILNSNKSYNILH